MLKVDLERAEGEALQSASVSAEREMEIADRVQAAEEAMRKAEIDLDQSREEVRMVMGNRTVAVVVLAVYSRVSNDAS